MRFRSSNSKFVHYQGDVLSNVDDSSHGVHLAGGSTGGIVQPAGDEDNIALTVRGKGTGRVNVGNSSQATFLAGSTFGFAFIQRVIVQIDSAAMVIAAEGTSDTVSTVTGATTNSLCVFMPHATFSTRYQFQTYCSTANEVRIRLFNFQATTFGSGQSSNRGTLYVFG